MVFRRDNNRVDAFQRQMNSLRQQIGGEDEQRSEPEPRERVSQSGDRPRQQRQSTDEGYSFGSLTSANVGPGQDDADDYDARSVVPHMPQADQDVTVVASDATLKGDIDVQGSVHVYGKVNGSITASDDVWIADGAEVDARVQADRVVIGGELEGHISARSRFEALPTCELNGDVDAPTFMVHEGATLNGSLSMISSSGQGPADLRENRNRSGSIIQRRARSTS